ncbi:MAG: accessory gene regulator B family protein [Oscillospiraceae bacterium]|nr:accessory gene regulator B family protein [Oscillospiraceae bacterium]
MFARLSDRIADAFVRSQTIPLEDREIYRCGVQQLLRYTVSFAATLAIGMFFGMFRQCAVFMAGYVPLRHSAGGFHAKTPFRCSLFSAVLTAAALGLIRFLSGTAGGCAVTLALSAVCILLLAPVGSENKPLDETERRVFRRRARLLTALLTAAAFGMMLLHRIWLCACLAAASAVLSAMLILGTVKNTLSNHHRISLESRSQTAEEDAE